MGASGMEISQTGTGAAGTAGISSALDEGCTALGVDVGFVSCFEGECVCVFVCVYLYIYIHSYIYVYPSV